MLRTTVTGRQVGLELTEWLDQGQIAEAKATETIEDSIRKANRPEPTNNTEHIHLAWLAHAAEGTDKTRGRGVAAARR